MTQSTQSLSRPLVLVGRSSTWLRGSASVQDRALDRLRGAPRSDSHDIGPHAVATETFPSAGTLGGAGDLLVACRRNARHPSGAAVMASDVQRVRRAVWVSVRGACSPAGSARAAASVTSLVAAAQAASNGSVVRIA